LIFEKVTILKNITEMVQLSLSVSTVSDEGYRHVGTFRLDICEFLEAHYYTCPLVGSYRFNFTYPYFLEEYDKFEDGTWDVRLEITSLDDDRQMSSSAVLSTCYMSLVLHEQYSAISLRKVFVFTALEVALMVGSIIVGYFARKKCRVVCLDELVCLVKDADEEEEEEASQPSVAEKPSPQRPTSHFALFQNAKQSLADKQRLPALFVSHSTSTVSAAGSFQHSASATNIMQRGSGLASVSSSLHSKPDPSPLLSVSDGGDDRISPQRSTTTKLSSHSPSSSSSGIVVRTRDTLHLGQQQSMTDNVVAISLSRPPSSLSLTSTPSNTMSVPAQPPPSSSSPRTPPPRPPPRDPPAQYVAPDSPVATKSTNDVVGDDENRTRQSALAISQPLPNTITVPTQPSPPKPQDEIIPPGTNNSPIEPQPTSQQPLQPTTRTPPSPGDASPSGGLFV
jgi:hypothetical protein